MKLNYYTIRIIYPPKTIETHGKLSVSRFASLYNAEEPGLDSRHGKEGFAF